MPTRQVVGAPVVWFPGRRGEGGCSEDTWIFLDLGGEGKKTFIGRSLRLVVAVPREGPCWSHSSEEGHRQPQLQGQEPPGPCCRWRSLQPSASLCDRWRHRSWAYALNAQSIDEIAWEGVAKKLGGLVSRVTGALVQAL